MQENMKIDAQALTAAYKAFQDDHGRTPAVCYCKACTEAVEGFAQATDEVQKFVDMAIMSCMKLPEGLPYVRGVMVQLIAFGVEIGMRVANANQEDPNS